MKSIYVYLAFIAILVGCTEPTQKTVLDFKRITVIDTIKEHEYVYVYDTAYKTIYLPKTMQLDSALPGNGLFRLNWIDKLNDRDIPFYEEHHLISYNSKLYIALEKYCDCLSPVDGQPYAHYNRQKHFKSLVPLYKLYDANEMKEIHAIIRSGFAHWIKLDKSDLSEFKIPKCGKGETREEFYTSNAYYYQ